MSTGLSTQFATKPAMRKLRYSLVSPCALSAALLMGAIVKLVRWYAPVAMSVICNSAVCAPASGNARIRIRAIPNSSVVVVPDNAVTSGWMPVADVMMRKAPDTTSNLTPLAASGTPPWEIATLTSASPPEQIAAPQAADCVEVGVIVTLLPTVPGFTVTDAETGVALPVSRAVSVTTVSTATGFGTSVTERPVTPPLTWRTAWLLDVTM